MMVISLFSKTGISILAGISGGNRCWAAIQDELIKHLPGEPVVLDLEGIEALGGSALRILLQKIKAAPSCAGSSVVLANLNDDNLAEADLVAEAMRAPYIAAGLVGGDVINPIVRGPLDEKVLKTFRLLLGAGEADAQTISRLSNESGVVTAWNNRLVALHSLGLLRERKVGKRKLYSPVIEGLTYGDRFHS